MSATIDLDTPDFTGEVHPLADALPMLPSDELADLAADIKANGLIDPITLDEDGRLLDGRNRLAACEMAGVEPRFVTHHGMSDALILARGGRRRNITAGQRAMLTARVMWGRGLWDADAGRWKYGAKAHFCADAQIDGHDLKMCGAILAHSTDLAALVLAGKRSLRDAYDEVQTARKAQAELDAKMQTLADEQPDLYRLVVAEELPLPEAWAAYLERTREQREAEKARIARIEQELERLAYGIDQAAAFAEYEHLVQRVIDEYDVNLTPHGKPITKTQILAAAEGLTALAERWPHK